MRIPGYCEKCHRVRQVRASGDAVALATARGGGVITGVCDECAEPRCTCGHPKSAHHCPAGQPVCRHCGGGYAHHAFEADRSW